MRGELYDEKEMQLDDSDVRDLYSADCLFHRKLTGLIPKLERECSANYRTERIC